MNTLHTIHAIRNANKAAGFHFFDADTMRSFNSRLCGQVYPTPEGTYFVTSERFDMDHSPRRYTVRIAHTDGSIHTVGEFQQYATLNAARHAAADAANAVLFA